MSVNFKVKKCVRVGGSFYNVQKWVSNDGGRTFKFSGTERVFSSITEVNDFIIANK